MRVIKCGLKGVVRDAESLALFEGAVQRLHRARTAAHLLCKLWLLERFRAAEPLPQGQGAVVSLFKDALMAIGSDTDDPRVHRLRALYQEAFPSDALSIRLGAAHNWPQNVANAYGAQVAEHLSRCYPRCLERYLACRLCLKGREHRAALGAALRAVMRKEASQPVPPEEAALLAPPRALLKGYVKYDVKNKKTVLDYLPCMLHMAAYLEGAGDPGFAVLPLVSTLVPASVFLDTDTLLAIIPDKSPLLAGHTKAFYAKEWRTANPTGKRGRVSQERFDDDGWMRKQERLYYGQARLWERVLDLTKLPVRGLSWCFDNRIHTDGVSIVVYLQHERDCRAKGEACYAEYPDEAYVHRLENDARAQYRGRTIVAIDPGKQNIIYAVDASTVRRAGAKLEAKTLRYTAKQRAAEMRLAESCAHAQAFRAITPMMEGRSLEDWEAWLSQQPSRRTLDVAAFRAHIRAFYAYAAAVSTFWADSFHREQRLDAHRRQQRSEARLANAFKTAFGKPEDVVVAFGDGARNGLVGRAPGPSTAIRRLLQRNHYAVLDVHEPYTSKRCFACKRPDAENGPCRTDVFAGRDAWGVRRCCRCATTWARDFHACLNIDRLAREHLAGFDRPDYLRAAGG